MFRAKRRTLHLCDLACSVDAAGIPAIPLSELIDTLQRRRTSPCEDVRMGTWLTGGGSGSVSEMAALAAIAAVAQPRIVLEIGTYDGAATWHLWRNVPDARIYTIDLPDGVVTEGSSDQGYQGHKTRSYLPSDVRVTLVEVDTRKWTPAIPEKVDLCFIDAGHTFECVQNDTEKVFGLLKAGGIVIWHDATWRRDNYGVNEYLLRLRRKGADIRLIRVGKYGYSSLAYFIVPTDWTESNLRDLVNRNE